MCLVRDTECNYNLTKNLYRAPLRSRLFIGSLTAAAFSSYIEGVGLDSHYKCFFQFYHIFSLL